MESDLDGYEIRIKKLESETAHYSEQSLLEHDNRVLASLREITQNIMAMEQENSLIEIRDKQLLEGDDIRLVITPSDLPEKINLFEELVGFLKVSHLEQEALDNFLRYTISSSNLLQINSVQDTKYMELESQVKELEQSTLETHAREIEATKDQTRGLCKDLCSLQDNINVTFLETSNALEECDVLLDELTHLRIEKQTNEETDIIEEDPVSQTYKEWESLQRGASELNTVKEEELGLRSRIQSLEDSQKRLRQFNNDSPQTIRRHKALELLVQIWIAKFLPQAGIAHLKLLPRSRKFQFDVENMFTTFVTVAADSGILKNIEIYRKETDGILLSHDLNEETKKYLGSNDIYNGLSGVLHMLKNTSNGGERASR